jgi:hypothetical protein
MPFKRTDGGLWWDDDAARREGRWGDDVCRPDVIELAEHLLERGSLERVWDTLALNRPAGLTGAEERRIVNMTLRRAAELGRPISPNAAAVLCRLIGGDGPLRGEARDMDKRRAIRSMLEADPKASNRKVAASTGTSRDLVRSVRDELYPGDS